MTMATPSSVQSSRPSPKCDSVQCGSSRKRPPDALYLCHPPAGKCLRFNLAQFQQSAPVRRTGHSTAVYPLNIADSRFQVWLASIWTTKMNFVLDESISKDDVTVAALSKQEISPGPARKPIFMTAKKVPIAILIRRASTAPPMRQTARHLISTKSRKPVQDPVSEFRNAGRKKHHLHRVCF